MGQNFGIGLGKKLMPLLLKLGAERGVILDHAIMHQCQFSGTV